MHIEFLLNNFRYQIQISKLPDIEENFNKLVSSPEVQKKKKMDTPTETSTRNKNFYFYEGKRKGKLPKNK